MRFEWDEEKAEENRRKHRVPFEKAQEVFDDPRAVPFEDLEHSTADETRYVMIGMSSMGLLYVSFTYSRGRYQVHLGPKSGKMDGKDL